MALRIVVQIIVVTLAIFIFLTTDKSQERGMILIFPFFFGIPAILFTLLVLAPIEAAFMSIGRRYWAYGVIVPVAGAAFLPGYDILLTQIAAGWSLLWVATAVPWRVAEQLAITSYPDRELDW